MLFVQGNIILYALGNEYLYGVMKSNPAPNPYFVKETSKNITHVWCVSVRIDSSGKSMFIDWRFCMGELTS